MYLQISAKKPVKGQILGKYSDLENTGLLRIFIFPPFGGGNGRNWPEDLPTPNSSHGITPDRLQGPQEMNPGWAYTK